MVAADLHCGSAAIAIKVTIDFIECVLTIIKVWVRFSIDELPRDDPARTAGTRQPPKCSIPVPHPK